MRISRLSDRYSLSSIALAFLVLLFLVLFFVYKKYDLLNVLKWDVAGYYLYLPATFIYEDLDGVAFYEELSEEYKTADGRANYGIYFQEDGRPVMKYTAGMAILYTPGFLAGHLIARATGYPADGFSQPYQFMLLFTSILYAFLGLLFLRKILLRYYEDWLVALTLLIIGLGTNYYYYVVDEGAMPHIHLFALVAILLYCTVRWHETFRWKYALWIGVTLGMAALVRPTEILFAIIPLCWGVGSETGPREQLQKFLRHGRQFLAAAAIIIAIGSIQLIYWKWATGSWIYYSYHGEGHFDFSNPHIWEGLFSYRKGWLVYTPVMLFALAGIYRLRKAVPQLLVPLLAFIIIYLYVTFSWNPWWYGGSFGMRPLVQAYVLFALPLAAFLEWAGRRLWLFLPIMAVIVFLGYLNIYQSFQRRKEIMHKENMDKQEYWRIFLEDTRGG